MSPVRLELAKAVASESAMEDLKSKSKSVFLVSLTGLISYEPTEQDLSLMHFPRNMGKKLSLYKAIHQKYVESLEHVAEVNNTPLIDLHDLAADPEIRAKL